MAKLLLFSPENNLALKILSICGSLQNVLVNCINSGSIGLSLKHQGCLLTFFNEISFLKYQVILRLIVLCNDVSPCLFFDQIMQKYLAPCPALVFPMLNNFNFIFSGRWNHIENLDEFFTRIYEYHQQYGFTCMVLSEFFKLV